MCWLFPISTRALPSGAIAGTFAGGTFWQRWSAKLGQADKWNFCLRAVRMPWISSKHDLANTTDPRRGLQDQGGIGRDQGGEDAGQVGAAV
jgi:hypothetical protein